MKHPRLSITPCAFCHYLLLGLAILLNIGALQETKAQTQNQAKAQVQKPLEIEMATLALPEIGGSIQIPTSWSIWTITEARAAVEKTLYPSQDAKAIALQAAGNTGSNNVRVSRYIEPYQGINPTLTIAWTPLGNADISKVPVKAQSEVCARMLKNTIIPQLTKFSKDIQIVEEPTPIDAKGTGAWVTIKESITLTQAPEKPLELLTRIYLLLSPKNFVLVTVSFSNKDDKEAGINKEILGTIMKSLSFQTSSPAQ